MKTSKKFLSVFLALLMIISIIPMSSITASAATVMKTQDEAVAWLNQQTNSLYGGGQCTEFVSAYMNWLITGTATASGSYIVPQWPQGYVTFAQSDPQNWTVIKNEVSTVPQPGDIFVSGNTHTGVVIVPDGIRGATIVDQNSREGYGENGTRSQIIYKNWTTYSGGPYTVTYFIRPNFKNTPTKVPTTGISLSVYSLTIDVGETRTITATVTPSNATDKSVTWSSSNTSVATVSSSGVVTAKAGGTCLITATASGGQTESATIDVPYTITYNANGGTGAPPSQKKMHGVTLTLSSTIPTRSGYTFLGWAHSNTANYVNYSAGGQYTSNSSTTLYAVWTPDEYTVSYNANGGTGAPSSQTKYHDTALTLSNTIPTRTGYTFLGWSTSSTATTATYSAGGSFTSNANTTLYAVWKATSTTLTANSSNDAVISSGGEIKYYTFTPSTSGKYVIYSTSSEDTKVYLYNSAGTELTYDDDSGENRNFRLEYEMTAGITYQFGIMYYGSSTTGTIPFKFGQVYTVSYHANGGTSTPSSQNKDYGATLTLSSYVPTRSGYTFLGWSTSSTATSATYSAGSNFTTDADTTLYAVWQANAVAEPEVHVSSTSVNLTLGETESTDVYVWATGVTCSYTVQYQIADTSIVSCVWGGWDSENKCPLTITAKAKGATTVTVSVINYETKEILDSIVITVNVGVSSSYVDFNIKEPSTTTIRYKDGIVLHIDGQIPDGARVEWAVDNNNFDGGVFDNGMSCLLVSKNNGYTIVVATLYDANDNVIATDSIEMRSKAGFFDKIGGFFRSLFGSTKIYDN